MQSLEHFVENLFTINNLFLSTVYYKQNIPNFVVYFTISYFQIFFQ